MPGPTYPRDMDTRGVGVPLVTPFVSDGAVDHEALRELVGWLEARGVDYLVPCGSTGEAELLTDEERAAVIRTVVEETTLPVLAGTGHPGYEATVATTRAAADVGADAALVVTPFYYDHDAEAMAAYYRDVADASDVPVYLYSVPAFTGVTLAPETVGELADHANVAGIKDSSGSIGRLVRTLRATPDDFDVLVGNTDTFAAGLDAGATGAILAVANLAPAVCDQVAHRHRDGDRRWARSRAGELVAVDDAVIGAHGIGGLKAAMRIAGAPAGRPRRPHRSPDEGATDDLRAVVAEL